MEHLYHKRKATIHQKQYLGNKNKMKQDAI